MRSRGHSLQLAAAGVVVFAAVAGCAQTPASSSTPVVSASASASTEPDALSQDPNMLEGTWAVANTNTTADGTVVTFTREDAQRGQAVISASCGTIEGEWAATDDGMFLGSVTAWTAECHIAEQDTEAGTAAQVIAWFTTATTFEKDTESTGNAVTFSNSADAETATLVALQSTSLTPAASADASSQGESAEQGEADGSSGDTDQDSGDTASQAGSASGESSGTSGSPQAAQESGNVDAAWQDALSSTMAQLSGTWVQEGRPQDAPTPPYIDLAADGTWEGSDGCNGLSGRWLIDSGGAVLATSNPTTLVGCSGQVSLGQALIQSYYMGVTDGALTLWDASGTILITLVTEEAGAEESSASSDAG
ncbi:MAG TPA: META domain-containing protein [Pseudoclavibacter sp.]|nr:META domain-containing protein [Pseudoclavibacter sp.]